MSTLGESQKQNPFFRNWVSCALALDFTKQAIVDFVVTTNDRSHADAIKDIPGTCSSCDFKSWNSCIDYPCKNKALRTEIVSVFVNCRPYTPSFVNTTPKDYWSEPWEFAKCFMPVKGGAYKKCRSADDTDIAGILSVMTNNWTFQSELPQIDLDQKDNIIRKVIGIRNELMHNPSFEIDDQTFNEYITVINGLLNKLPVTTATRQGRAKIHEKIQYPFKRLDVTFQTEKSCSITGMVKIDANRLAVVDNQNKRVKIIDVHKNEIESSVQIKDPWDITRVSERQLIVSCGRMLQFLEHKDGNLTVGGKQIPIAGESKGIDFAGEKLIVTFPSPERAVRIIDMDGTIMNTIYLKEFETPLYVKFGPDEQIFIADYDSQKVMCLDNAGSLKYRLTNNELKGPHGLTIDGKGNVYISGYKTNNIHVIRINEVAPNLSKFLETKDGMDRPQALAYCDIENKLYISQTESGTHIVSVHNGLNAVSPGDGDGS